MADVSDYRRSLAYKAGHKAALAGKLRTANNREPCTIYADDWYDGHNEGVEQIQRITTAHAHLKDTNDDRE